MKVKVAGIMLIMSGVICFVQDKLKEREKQAAFDTTFSSYSLQN